jgi:hypothetical protein
MTEGALHVHPDIAGPDRDRVRLGGRQPGRERVVHQQAPDVPVGHLADQVLDVDSPVAERAPRTVGLGDLRLECDYTFEPGLEVRHLSLLVSAMTAGARIPGQAPGPGGGSHSPCAALFNNVSALSG